MLVFEVVQQLFCCYSCDVLFLIAVVFNKVQFKKQRKKNVGGEGSREDDLKYRLTTKP